MSTIKQNHILGLGSCRILTPLFKLFKVNKNLIVHNCLENFFEKQTFTGNNFLGKLHNSKEIIQFLKLIQNKITLSNKIMSLFLTSFSNFRCPSVPREKNPIKILENIKSNFNIISTVFIEISSIKIYELDKCFVNLEHIASNNPYIRNWKSIMKKQKKNDLINDLKIIVDMLGKKNVVFITHINIDNIKNRIIIKEAIEHVVLNYNSNNNLFMIDPIVKLGKEMLLDDKLHFNIKGINKYKDILVNYIKLNNNTIPSVTVLQSDNRVNNKMVNLSMKINENACKTLNYDYKFINTIEIINKYKLNNSWSKINFILAKIFVVNEFLKTCNTDYIIYLDTDAWIQEKYYMKQLINKLHNSSYNGAFSRDPYVYEATFINSGSFIIKVNDFIKNMYKNIINTFNKFGGVNFTKNNMILDKTDKNDNYKKVFGDQYFISDCIYNNKNKFLIFEPTILNTPNGIILRHNWWKDIKLYDDADKILNCYIFKSDIFNFNKYLDNKSYPSTAKQNMTNMYCFPLETAKKFSMPIE